jgi:hypothetical protein
MVTTFCLAAAPTSGAQYMSDRPFEVVVRVDCVMSRTVDSPKSDTAACKGSHRWR